MTFVTMSESGFQNAMGNLEIATETDRDQFRVLLEALDLFRVKNMKYMDLWKVKGYPDSLSHIEHKTDRLVLAKFRPLDFAQQLVSDQDAHDLINYCSFFIRNVRAVR